MNVALIGLSPTTHDLAPWDDPEWEKWGLPWDGAWAHLDRLFEMHALRLLEGAKCRPEGYTERLRDADVPLYMQEAYFNGATRYPFDKVAEVTGPYWNSSIGYMLALAIAEGAERIGLWGVDMAADDEFGYQRPNAEYLIGLARGMGIDVVIPQESPLCKFQKDGIRFGDNEVTYADRYGWLG